MFFGAFPISAKEEYNKNPLNISDEEFNKILSESIDHSVRILEKMDIVRNPKEKWNNTDFLKRRNAFEMAYIVRSYGMRELCLKSLNSLICDSLKSCNYSDVELYSYDNMLLWELTNEATFWYATPLIRGKTNEKGERIADFDSYITYNEAFVLIFRLLNADYQYSRKIDEALLNKYKQYPYYRYAEEIGLINSNTLMNCSTLSVSENMLEEYIPAYEFMHLLYYSMYLPVFETSGDYAPATKPGFRYIDKFIKEYGSFCADDKEDEDRCYIET